MLLSLDLYCIYSQNRDQKCQDRVCLNHRREQHSFTELIRLLSYDTDGRCGCHSLIFTGDKTYDTDRHTSCKDQKSCLRI